MNYGHWTRQDNDPKNIDININMPFAPLALVPSDRLLRKQIWSMNGIRVKYFNVWVKFSRIYL